MNNEELRKLDAEMHTRILGLEIGTDMAGYPNLPRYSSEIHRAWEVIEKVKRRFPVFTLDSKFDTWSAGFGCEQCGVLDGDWHVADSAPLAICRAALAAIEEQA